MSAKPLKILACGDVTGRFAAWLKRVDSVCAKAGPFDLALCVGSFFSPADASSADDEQCLQDVKSGRRRLPLPVYVLGPNSQAEVGRFGDLAGYEICENLVYLGSHGCYTTREGLRIAYLSGAAEAAGDDVDKPFAFSYSQVKEMQVQLKWDDYNYLGVDILLTSQWPQGISNNTSSKPELSSSGDNSSKLISKLALHSRPRYHFAGLKGLHYERQPYRNHKVLSDGTKHVTRFIGLAKVGNPNKAKWLYAFNIAPAKVMDRRELSAQPPDATDCPFDAAAVAAEAADGQRSTQFFYDMSAPVEGEGRGGRRGGKRGGRGRDSDFGGERGGFQKRPRREPAGPCWFCLSGSEVEKHLVVSVGDHCYLALPKGGLTKDHVLILPIAHHASSLELPEEVEEEMGRFKRALRKCFRKNGQSVVFMERNYKSHHLQLQAVAIPAAAADGVKSAFLETAESQEIELAEMPDHAQLTQMAEPGTPFFYAELPAPAADDGAGKQRLFHRVRSGFPINFGRDVLASRAVLNVEERVDWRACKGTAQEEADNTKAFRNKFEPFDFTLEDDDD